MSMGCVSCRHLQICGGLYTKGDLFSCHDLCCNKPESCETVCEKKVSLYIESRREVHGFDLDTVPRTTRLQSPSLPSHIPLVYHGTGREDPFDADAVCLPLSRLLPHIKTLKTPEELALHFRFTPTAKVIVSGVDRDPEIERWWGKTSQKAGLIKRLKDLGIAMITSPNYSLFTNVPRVNDMHNMKRIAIVHSEFLLGGLPAALHVNARTERDWERWAEFLSLREEITHVSVEFATGARVEDRKAWHVEQLITLARAVGRPLSLVIRGAYGFHDRIAKEFKELIWLDATPFFKTQSRQRAYFDVENAKLKWRSSPTAPGELLDELLQHNWRMLSQTWL